MESSWEAKGSGERSHPSQLKIEHEIVMLAQTSKTITPTN
jgi:hypothetical protein